jgi:hypothetical protein
MEKKGSDHVLIKCWSGDFCILVYFKGIIEEANVSSNGIALGEI